MNHVFFKVSADTRLDKDLPLISIFLFNNFILWWNANVLVWYHLIFLFLSKKLMCKVFSVKTVQKKHFSERNIEEFHVETRMIDE